MRLRVLGLIIGLSHGSGAGRPEACGWLAGKLRNVILYLAEFPPA
jgi:hypothetical protein